jgi:hypothetical protein
MGAGPGHAQEVENLLDNGGWEDGVLTPWWIYGDASGEAVQTLDGAAVPEEPVEGDYCLHITVPTAGANYYDAGLGTSAVGTFEAGKKYTLSAFCKCSSGTLQINFKPELGEDPYTGYGEQQFTMTDEWQEYYVTTPVFVDDVTPANITFHIAFAAGDFWIDNIRFYEGDYVPFVSPRAQSPTPADGSTHDERVVWLKWEAGASAASHDLYFGEDFDAVSSGTPDTFQTNQESTSFLIGLEPPYPDGLVPGTTYYWRIDEVNDVDPNSPWQGHVWSFTVRPLTAWGPLPADGMKFVDVNPELSWNPGKDALFHWVYFAESFDEVNDAPPPAGWQTSDPVYTPPDTLAPGTTYYWRVDEFTYPGAKTHTGPVWSFTTGKEGGGLRGDYYHWSGSSPPTPPESAFQGGVVITRTDPGIDFDWGQDSPEPDVVDVNNFAVVWTGELEVPLTGTYTFYPRTDDGVILWVNGEELVSSWQDRSATEDDAQIDLQAGQIVPIQMWYYEAGGDAVAQLSWSSDLIPKRIIPAAALSLPVRASNPKPANGTVDVSQTPQLTWSAGQNAVQHDVYFGADENLVADADTTSTGIYRGRQNGTSYNPGALEWNTTYYWRIDEVNNLHPDSPWEGSVWSFTTADFVIVDNFEQYTDITPNRIWQTWLDGVGYSEPPPGHAGNGTGSQVGNDDPPFTEQTTVHSGGQAMTFRYTNDGSTGKAMYSEAERDFAVPQNWTQDGVKALTLWFYGDSGNSAEPLYVGLQDSLGTRKDVPHQNSGAVLVGSWQEFNIDLQEFANAGVNLTSIKKVYIGVGNRLAPQMGGTGTLYFDDIRLYRPRCVASKAKPAADLSGNCVVDYADVEILTEQWLGTGYLVTPTQPSTVGLAAYYPLDNNTQDASGNGHAGTASGDPAYVAGPAGYGMAMEFDGQGGQYVDLGTWNPSATTGQVSLALWARWNGLSGSYQGLIGKRNTWSADEMMWNIEANVDTGALGFFREGSYPYDGDPVLPVGEWTHVAASFDGTTATFYINGETTGSGPFSFGFDTDATIVFGAVERNGSNPFNGALDEVRIYSRSLSAGEVAWLAGRTEPFSVSFDLSGDGVVDFKDYAILTDAWLDELLWP